MYAIRKNRWRSINELEGSSPKDQWPIVVQYQRNADIIYMSFLHPQMKIASSSPCWRNSVLLLLFCKQVSQRRHFIDQLSVEDFDVSRHLALLILHQQESTLNDINHRPIIPLLACLCFSYYLYLFLEEEEVSDNDGHHERDIRIRCTILLLLKGNSQGNLSRNVTCTIAPEEDKRWEDFYGSRSLS